MSIDPLGDKTLQRKETYEKASEANEWPTKDVCLLGWRKMLCSIYHGNTVKPEKTLKIEK